ncbi:hypothetical protein K9N68_20520 [Kovacikia minuta CCNUW1]|uniref:hypothetical protein n=1 Tax=Kovacikia minuta TaxID=2931930 RepID=UPI001CC9CA45|nr:hypothetical protein [Kovacikia minuta]UBF24098.1 hypothetical protein K9N68_20520 [Kovacikia minuta CCNUW1]
MVVQKIPLESAQKIRQLIKNTLTIPESENHPRTWSSYDEVDQLPEPDSLSDLGELFNFGGPIEEATYAPNTKGQWFISSTNPGAALVKLPGLKLKPELRLVSYLHRHAKDGVGVIWAVPEALSTTAQLEKGLSNRDDRSHPPQPEGALPDVMEAIEGDRSPASFVIASILCRELQEFGAIGKFCNWTHHRLINALPNQVHWQWKIEEPKDLSPKVRVFPDGKVAIEFFTCRVAPPVAIFQHIDQYPNGHYKAAKLDRPIAVAQRA